MVSVARRLRPGAGLGGRLAARARTRPPRPLPPPRALAPAFASGSCPRRSRRQLLPAVRRRRGETATPCAFFFFVTASAPAHRPAGRAGGLLLGHQPRRREYGVGGDEAPKHHLHNYFVTFSASPPEVLARRLSRQPRAGSQLTARTSRRPLARTPGARHLPGHRRPNPLGLRASDRRLSPRPLGDFPSFHALPRAPRPSPTWSPAPPPR